MAKHKPVTPVRFGVIRIMTRNQDNIGQQNWNNRQDRASAIKTTTNYESKNNIIDLRTD